MENVRPEVKKQTIDSLVNKIKELAGEQPVNFRFSGAHTELDSMSSTGWRCSVTVDFDMPWQNVH